MTSQPIHQVLSRLQRLQPRWQPSLRLSKLGTLPSNPVGTWAPQGNGAPGWLYLTRNPLPIAYYIPRVPNPVLYPIRVVFDSRCFEDTVFRVEKTTAAMYIADVWMFNGETVFDKHSFSTRQVLLKNVYDNFYTPCPPFETCAILLRATLRDVRGQEFYTHDKGARGIYVESTPGTDEVYVVATDVPDVYRIPAENGYLQVKTLVLSKYLRTLGPTFTLRCRRNEDGTWTPVLSSTSLTNEDSPSPPSSSTLA